MQMAASTMPELIVTHEIQKPGLEALISGGWVYEITEADLRTYMPNFTKRVEDLGLPLSAIIESNKWSDGKLYTVPWEFRAIVFPSLRSDIRHVRDAVDSPYCLYLRDDILKMIYPNARTEQELKELFVKKRRQIDNRRRLWRHPHHQYGRAL